MPLPLVGRGAERSEAGWGVFVIGSPHPRPLPTRGSVYLTYQDQSDTSIRRDRPDDELMGLCEDIARLIDRHIRDETFMAKGNWAGELAARVIREFRCGRDRASKYATPPAP